MKILFFLIALTTQLQASTVLFIGDSHSVGPFGWAFDQHLRDAGHTVGTYASCGSIPRWWFNGQKTTCGYFSRNTLGEKTQSKEAQTPLIDQLLKDIKPDVVVMEFGGNYVKTPSDEFVINDIKKIVSVIKTSGTQCFWITNPDTRTFRAELPRITALIKTAVGEDCPIFESHLVTRYPETGGDGVHYWNTLGTPIAKSWALKAFESFQVQWP
jgi:hypothetical protein